MRNRGGHILGAKKRVGFAGWARSVLALAMALFFVAQGPAVHAQGGRPLNGAAVGQKCERTGVAVPGHQTRGPATDLQHDCEACLACFFASVADASSGRIAQPVRTGEIVAPFPQGFSAPPTRWRIAHSARAPPLFS
ncbi:hypothetical protein [Methylocystis parvus]|uniref:hypothetical protein n=1 Tax=Methylocystis parvus TaxID=134 RepID=UPI003C77DF0E